MISEVKEVSHKAGYKIQREKHSNLTYGSLKLSIAEERKTQRNGILTKHDTSHKMAVIEATKAATVAVREVEDPTVSR